MIPEDQYDDIVVTVAHPWGDVDFALSNWVVRPPARPLTSIVAARRQSTGDPVDLAEIPLEYHNTWKSRRLQRLGQLPTPWGTPPDDSPPPVIDANTPESVRKIIMSDYYD
jgi:hypothetical protein